MKLFHITSFFAKIALVLRICTKKMQRVLKAALEKCKFGQKMHCYGARLLWPYVGFPFLIYPRAFLSLEALPGEILLAEAVAAEVVAEVDDGACEGEEWHGEEEARHVEESRHAAACEYAG